jgi:hypothetical protein
MGGSGGIRTLTPFRITDFKSVASTSSATEPDRGTQRTYTGFGYLFDAALVAAALTFFKELDLVMEFVNLANELVDNIVQSVTLVSQAL